MRSPVKWIILDQDSPIVEFNPGDQTKPGDLIAMIDDKIRAFVLRQTGTGYWLLVTDDGVDWKGGIASSENYELLENALYALERRRMH